VAELLELHPRLMESLRSGRMDEAGALLGRCQVLMPALAGYYGRLSQRLQRSA
jgi:hypothetical protein